MFLKVKILILRPKNEFILTIMGMVREVMNLSLSILQPPIFNRGKRRNLSILRRLVHLSVSWTLVKWFNKKF